MLLLKLGYIYTMMAQFNFHSPQRLRLFNANMNARTLVRWFTVCLGCSPASLWTVHAAPATNCATPGRERISINDGWRFQRFEFNPDGIIYDYRHDLANLSDASVLRPWILPSANDFIVNPDNQYPVPADPAPGGNISFIQPSFNDEAWESVKLPHDWAIGGPFYTGPDPPVGGGMGRLPVQGVGWYRRRITIHPKDKGKSVYLDIDGAMSYAIVWLNGHLVGGWPYGYNSFRLNLTPFLEPGDQNQLAIRLDNPLDSARWYPGGGLYRNVWLTKLSHVHVGYQGTHITTRDITDQSATVELAVSLLNRGQDDGDVTVETEIFDRFSNGTAPRKVARSLVEDISITAGEVTVVNQTLLVSHPQLWGPPPTQTPNLYLAVTRVLISGEVVDTYKTEFGIRRLDFDPNQGFSINGERVEFKGVNEHHDLGALGAAFNTRAAERKLEILQELGVNSIRMSHNPPATEFLQLTDRMGFLVIDEIFDSWQRNKTDGDFHLIFDDWHEADARSFVRRDRNHASVVAWSFGNEVGEQYTDEDGAALGRYLHDIIISEDSTRPTTASMNYAKPDMPFGNAMDFLSINYQGSGIRDTPNYSNLQGIRTHPLYPDFHEAFPDKLIVGSETASTLSTRGTFIFPVAAEDTGAPVNASSGGDPATGYVSAYELYTAGFGSPPDKVWVHQDQNPFVAGEFVWTGFDYIGEPTPYYSSRSSYCGILDLAGFKKDRFYHYQARWRPDLRTAHILPHWNWPDRNGKVTPVHVFSSADEAELFLNGESQGRVVKDEYQYRFRWDNVIYEPGELLVVTWKNGEPWARELVRTVGEANELKLTADRATISNDGLDLSFVTVEVQDAYGQTVPTAADEIFFSVSGPGIIVGTDNGDPADMEVFPSLTRRAFSGLALAILRAEDGGEGTITITAKADGLVSASIEVNLR